jgi:hypothetical protein
MVWRIWRIDKGNREFRFQSQTRGGSRPLNKLQHVMRTVIESGLLYTGTSLITFVTYVTNSVAVYVTTDIVRPPSRTIQQTISDLSVRRSK